MINNAYRRVLCIFLTTVIVWKESYIITLNILLFSGSMSSPEVMALEVFMNFTEINFYSQDYNVGISHILM